MQEQQTNITALVSYKVFPPVMGGQKGIALFYQYLSELLPVTIVSTKNNESPNIPGIRFLPLLGNSKLRYANPALFFKMQKVLRQTNCTHLIIEHPYYGWLGILLKRFCGVKLVVHSHNMEAMRFKSTGRWWWKLLWQYERFVHRHADINFFITTEDRDYAVKHFALDPQTCHSVTYGIESSETPATAEKDTARQQLLQLHKINKTDRILFFNGTLDYKPNLDAVDIILEQINPLLKKMNFNYKLIICGKNLPASYAGLEAFIPDNIIYAGFVDDIDVYFKGADIFINPVTDGGGIKTKVVEALSHGLSVVSTASGAIGIPATAVLNKMQVVNDGAWEDFTNAVIKCDPSQKTPAAFFDHFYWGNIVARVHAILTKQENLN